jgi:hypothetical protein
MGFPESQRVRELLAELDDTVTEVHLRSGDFEVTLKRQPKASAAPAQVFGQAGQPDDLAGLEQFMPIVPRG